MINLNFLYLNVRDFHYGKTQNVEVLLGCNRYMLDVDKCVCAAQINFYKKLSDDRESYSKYDPEADMVSVSVKPDAILGRDFFVNIEEISKAQHCCKRYDRELAM